MALSRFSRICMAIVGASFSLRERVALRRDGTAFVLHEPPPLLPGIATASHRFDECGKRRFLGPQAYGIT